MLGEERRGRRGGYVRGPLKLEVTIGGDGAAGETDRVPVIRGFTDVDPVIGTVDLRQRETGMKLDVDRHRIDESAIGMRDRRRDALGVGHLVGIRSPPAAGLAVDGERARDVAGRDNHREAQPEGAGVVAQRLLVLDRDRDFVARPDVRHAGREDIRALLLDERCLAALGLRLLVYGARLAALADLPRDPPLPDLHLEMVDGGLLRQRKHVDAFLPL